jgi:hypothetical protein
MKHTHDNTPVTGVLHTKFRRSLSKNSKDKGITLAFLDASTPHAHLYLVPRSKNAWSYTSIPPIRLHGVVLS